MPNVSQEARAILRLTLTPGLGPVLIARLIRTFGSAQAAAEAPRLAIRQVKGIGEKTASAVSALRAQSGAVDSELALADSLSVTILTLADPDYPPLLRQIPDPPPLLYVRGSIEPAGQDRYPLALVGSRSCTHYGLEQSVRFSQALAAAGLTIVSGGARGIDSAAHEAALRAANGRTIAVLGCGLAHAYPPDNQPLFDRIAAGRGAVISELPLKTPPSAENFPARNRIISGLSLGTLVIEAGHQSGSLITARLAAEDHGREVFALPGRVDSTASFGSLDLIKLGGAALVTHPDDILKALENVARHHFQGTHEALFGRGEADQSADSGLFSGESRRSGSAPNGPSIRDASLTAVQSSILAALSEPRTIDDLVESLSLDPSKVRVELTMLEIMRRVRREGSRLTKI